VAGIHAPARALGSSAPAATIARTTFRATIFSVKLLQLAPMGFGAPYHPLLTVIATRHYLCTITINKTITITICRLHIRSRRRMLGIGSVWRVAWRAAVCACA
jgi:hypothetical protein